MRSDRISGTAKLPQLLRDRAFLPYLGASIISDLGDSISALAVPLIATLTLHGSPGQISMLAALIWLPSLLFALLAGAWADRSSHRRIAMITANLVAAVMLASIPIAYLFHVLTIWQLYLVVFAGSTCLVLFNVCDSVLFVSLVEPSRYIEGQSLLNTGVTTATLIGPSLSGLLIQALSGPWVVLFDAASFFVSALLLSRIKPAEPLPARGSSGIHITSGLRFIRDDNRIRSMLAVAASVNFFSANFYALFVLFLARNLHASPRLIGVLLTAAAVGGLTGSIATRHIMHWVNEGWTLLIGSVAICGPLILVPMTRDITMASLGLLLLALFFSGFGRAVQNITIGSVFAVLVPDALRARTKGAFQTVSFGGRLLGSLFAGLIGSALGLRSALWIAAVGGALMFIWLLPSDLLKDRLIERAT